LTASLPRNDPDLARAAREGGADVVKVYLDISDTHLLGALVGKRVRWQSIDIT
jgi:hypothetical protein